MSRRITGLCWKCHILTLYTVRQLFRLNCPTWKQNRTDYKADMQKEKFSHSRGLPIMCGITLHLTNHLDRLSQMSLWSTNLKERKQLSVITHCISMWGGGCFLKELKQTLVIIEASAQRCLWTLPATAVNSALFTSCQIYHPLDNAVVKRFRFPCMPWWDLKCNVWHQTKWKWGNKHLFLSFTFC